MGVLFKLVDVLFKLVDISFSCWDFLFNVQKRQLAAPMSTFQHSPSAPREPLACRSVAPPRASATTGEGPTASEAGHRSGVRTWGPIRWGPNQIFKGHQNLLLIFPWLKNRLYKWFNKAKTVFFALFGISKPFLALPVLFLVCLAFS